MGKQNIQMGKNKQRSHTENKQNKDTEMGVTNAKMNRKRPFKKRKQTEFTAPKWTKNVRLKTTTNNIRKHRNRRNKYPDLPKQTTSSHRKQAKQNNQNGQTKGQNRQKTSVWKRQQTTSANDKTDATSKQNPQKQTAFKHQKHAKQTAKMNKQKDKIGKNR